MGSGCPAPTLGAIVQLASTLNPPEVVAATLARTAERLRRRNISHHVVSGDSAPPDALLVLTGGREYLAPAR